MKYVLLIYGDAELYANQTKEEFEADLAGHHVLGQEITASGEQIGGAALQDPHTATTIRVRGDDTVVTDGPFAETKEVLGGYYLVDCEDLDRAIEIASRIPDARHGCVEIRPLLKFDTDDESDEAATADAAVSA